MRETLSDTTHRLSYAFSSTSTRVVLPSNMSSSTAQSSASIGTMIAYTISLLPARSSVTFTRTVTSLQSIVCSVMYSNNRGEMFQEWAFYSSLDTTITTRSRKITRCCVLLYTEDRSDRTWIPISVKPISLVECFMEIGYGTDRVKQFHVNFSYGAIGIKQTSSDNALSYLEAMFKEEASFNPFHTKDDTNEIG